MMNRTLILFGIFIFASLFYLPIAMALNGVENVGTILGATALCFFVSLINVVVIMPIISIKPGKGRASTSFGTGLLYIIICFVLILINFLFLFFGSLISDMLSMESIISTIYMSVAFGAASFVVYLIFDRVKQRQQGGSGGRVSRSNVSSAGNRNSVNQRRNRNHNRASSNGLSRNGGTKNSRSGYDAVIEELKQRQGNNGS